MVGRLFGRHGLLNLQVNALINELSLILKRNVNGYRVSAFVFKKQ